MNTVYSFILQFKYLTKYTKVKSIYIEQCWARPENRLHLKFKWTNCRWFFSVVLLVQIISEAVFIFKCLTSNFECFLNGQPAIKFDLQYFFAPCTTSTTAQWCVFNNYSLDKHRHQIWDHFLKTEITNWPWILPQFTTKNEKLHFLMDFI